MFRQMWDPATESMPRKRLQELQVDRLRWQVQNCYQLSPFYRRKLDAAGVRPEQIRSLDDIRRLPFTTKEELRLAQVLTPPLGDLVTVSPSEYREIYPSSGTTGPPVDIVWCESDVNQFVQNTARFLWTLGVRPGDLMYSAYKTGFRLGGLTILRAAPLIGCAMLPLGLDQLSYHLHYLVNYKPDVLLTSPTLAVKLAEECERVGLSPRSLSLKRGAFGAQPGVASATVRRQLEETFGFDAFDMYGLAEIGPSLAGECEYKNGLHWCEDQQLIEVIDPVTMEPCPPGKLGGLVMTDLTKRGMPLLRYWTDDMTSLTAEPCKCGRTHVRSPHGVMGRRTECIHVGAISFYPVQVESAIRCVPGTGSEFRIVLHRGLGGAVERVTVTVEGRGGAPLDELRQNLSRALSAEIGFTPHVEVVPGRTLGRADIKSSRIVDEGPANRFDLERP